MILYGYIYKTTNSVNGKIYIGRHKIDKFDLDYLGSGTLLSKAIKKHGRANFSVKLLIWCNSEDDLNQTEIRLIRLYRKLLGSDKLYNIADGGHRPFCSFTPEIRKKMSESQKRLAPLLREHRRLAHLGKKHTDVAKEKNRISSTGRKHTEAAKEKIRIRFLGKKHSPARVEKNRQSHIGLKHTEESKLKNRAHRHTEEVKIQIKEASIKMHDKRRASGISFMTEEVKARLRAAGLKDWERRRALGLAKRSPETIAKMVHTRARNKAHKIFDNHPHNVASRILANCVSETFEIVK